VKLRPLEFEDLERFKGFFDRLSDESRYMRFMGPMPRLTPETMYLLARTLVDERSITIVAIKDQDGEQDLIGGGRIVPTDRPAACEYALSIVDEWQGHGLGTILLKELERQAKKLGYHEIEGAVLAANTRMLEVASHLRFQLVRDREDPGVVTTRKHLYIVTPWEPGTRRNRRPLY
jgi:acetyltransferase